MERINSSRVSLLCISTTLASLCLLAGCAGVSARSNNSNHTPGQVTARATSLVFGSVPTGSNESLPETLTNTGGSALTISQLAVSGLGFSIAGVNTPITLNPNQSISFNITFGPNAPGSVAGNLKVISNASDSNLSISLSATGTSIPSTGQLTITPASISFGTTTVGTSLNQTATLSAAGGTVTVWSAQASQAAFSVSGISFPLTIASGSTVSFEVSFAPQAIGAASGTVSFLSNATNSPTLQSVTGSGSAVVGNVFYVSPSGNDSNPGTLSSPWRTINSSLTRLNPGDTLFLRGGTYFESVNATVSGTSVAPITIESYPGENATIDSGVPAFRTVGNSDWELFNSSIGEYRSVNTYPSGPGSGNENIPAYIDGIPGYVNERVVLIPYLTAAAFRSTNDQYVDSSTQYYAGPGIFWDSSDSRIHIRLSKTSQMNFAESRYGTVLANDNDNPANYSIILSEAQNTLLISGSHLTFKNIEVNPAHFTVQFTGSASYDTFDGMKVWMGYYAVLGDNGNVHHITLTRSRFYGDGPYWVFWNDVDGSPGIADNLAGCIIFVQGGTHDWTISYNHIRGSSNDLFSTNDHEYNLFIHHNRFENGHDDAIEFRGFSGSGPGHVEVYENFVTNTLTMISAGQDAVGWTGPLFVYRNVMVQLRLIPVNRTPGGPETWDWQNGAPYGYEYSFKQNGSGYFNPNTHYYHNTVILINTQSKGINLTPQNPAGSILVDNLLVGINDQLNENYLTGAGEVINNNLYWKMNPNDPNHLLGGYDTVPAFSAATGFELNGLGSVPKQGTNPEFLNWSPQPVDATQTIWSFPPSQEVWTTSDFLLGPSSPAVGAGMPLPTLSDGTTPPDTRNSNDIGALPYGVSASEYDIFPYVPTLNP